MKIALKVFNCIILALSLVAGICLFAMPTLSLNSNIALNIEQIANFLPENEYTTGLDVVHVLGTDTIEVAISFKLNIADTTKVMGGNREIINNEIISKNIGDIADTLHEPIDLITDYSFRYVIKSITEKEVTKQIEEAIASQPAGTITSTAEDIKMEAGMDDAYFTNLSYVLYDAANADNATVDSVTDVLFDQIDEALSRADFKTQLDKSMFDQEANKEAVRTNLVSLLDDYQLTNSDGTLKKLNQLSYVMFADYLYGELHGKVADPTEIEQKTGESSFDYADRLVRVFVLTQMPDFAYQVIGYVSVGLLIGLIVFAALWIILFTFTMIRLFSKNKPWTFFGPWFWIFGSLQLVLGLGLTIFGKFILPNMNLGAIPNMPITKLILAPRTYALVPSMIFIACIAVAIAYAFIKGSVKRSMRNNPNSNNPNTGYYDANNYQNYNNPNNNGQGGYY